LRDRIKAIKARGLYDEGAISGAGMRRPD